MNKFGGGNMLYLDDIQVTNSTSAVKPSENFCRIYPNPFSENLHIQSENLPVNITIFDVQGKLVFQQNIKVSSMEIETDRWLSGVYIVKIQTDNYTFHQKFIKL